MNNYSNVVRLLKKGLAELCYGFLSTLANPTRLAIMEKLYQSDMNVTQLSKAFKQDQSMISHNLKKLMLCRLVYSTRSGKSTIYSLNIETAEAIFNTVRNHAQKHCPYKGSCPRSLVRTNRRKENVLQSM
jgi:DNA-binding transcriptional ArsR family regulator